MQQTAALPKRLSCDRCYAQKLRCPRPSTNDDASCIRCLRQKVQCVYSTALPKGRPRAAVRACAAGAGATAGAPPITTTTTTAAPSSSVTAPPIFSTEDLASLTGLSTSGWLPDPTWEDSFCFLSSQVVPQPPPLDTTPPPRSLSASGLDNPENCVGRLSDLATRLHAVYQTTRALSDHPLITNAAFEAVTTLFNAPLSPPSAATTAATTNLRETFTSSRHLLETITHLLWATPNNNPSTAPAAAADETVIYHFTIACYSLLLLIYATLLTALHRDALTHTQPSLSTTTTTTGPDNNTSTWCSAPSLVELRLVLLFHMITYFLDRLQQMIRMYTAEFEKQASNSTTGRRPPTSGRWSEEVEEMMVVEEPWEREQHIPPPPPPTSSLGSISELETQARAALMQLRMSLVATRGGLVDN
ncbi:hypothetical protein CBS147343_6064 [Aspergillus niger]|nr:hypothetical protein CBS147343_6064 [Aspergillus niger]